MSNEFACWKCGKDLINVILPMSRREECAKCHADQHVCNMCIYYVKGRCDEERAEHISDTERANFCDYFKPNNNQGKAFDDQKSAKAKAEFAALFGDELPEKNLDEELLSPAELADKKLRDMLNGF